MSATVAATNGVGGALLITEVSYRRTCRVLVEQQAFISVSNVPVPRPRYSIRLTAPSVVVCIVLYNCTYDKSVGRRQG